MSQVFMQEFLNQFQDLGTASESHIESLIRDAFKIRPKVGRICSAIPADHHTAQEALTKVVLTHRRQRRLCSRGDDRLPHISIRHCGAGFVSCFRTPNAAEGETVGALVVQA